MKDTQLKKQIIFTPGYDYVVRPTKKYGKEYGRHCMELTFLLQGKLGAVQFKMYTGWYPRIKRGWGVLHSESTIDTTKLPSVFPMAVDLGSHSPKPMYKGQTPIHGKCPVLDGRCYYSGSTLQADRVMCSFINKGEKALWKELREYYMMTFGSLT